MLEPEFDSALWDTAWCPVNKFSEIQDILEAGQSEEPRERRPEEVVSWEESIGRQWQLPSSRAYMTGTGPEVVGVLSSCFWASVFLPCLSLVSFSSLW